MRLRKAPHLRHSEECNRARRRISPSTRSARRGMIAPNFYEGKSNIRPQKSLAIHHFQNRLLRFWRSTRLGFVASLGMTIKSLAHSHCANVLLRHSERSKRAGGTLRSRTSQSVQQIARFGEQNAVAFWNLAGAAKLLYNGVRNNGQSRTPVPTLYKPANRTTRRVAFAVRRA